MPTKNFGGQSVIGGSTAEQEGCLQVSNTWSGYFYFLYKNNKLKECLTKHSRIRRFT